MTTRSTPLLQVAESILYLSSLLSDQPRAIDRYIDYFGWAVAGRRACPEASSR